jgi:AT-binding transcription factor 1
MNIIISERHVYKYRCKLCSLAFKTHEKLSQHSLYHTMRDATKCNICNRNFRSQTSLQKHMEQHHQGEDLSPRGSPNMQAANMEASAMAMDDDMSSLQSDDQVNFEQYDYLNSSQIAEQEYKNEMRKHKCSKCKMSFTHSIYLQEHYKSAIHKRNTMNHEQKVLPPQQQQQQTYPTEKYLDPNRPFKCDICRESFTQKNILLVHYNSVSHLHKLKKQQFETSTSSPIPTSPNSGSR